MQFEALKVALKQDATGFVLTLKIHPDEIPEELLRDFVGARYGVAMVRINDDETVVKHTGRVQKAGMLCKSPAFQKFLGELYSYEFSKVDEQVATQLVYRICDIQSRTELNGNKSAQECFDSMVEEFAEWSKKNEPF